MISEMHFVCHNFLWLGSGWCGSLPSSEDLELTEQTLHWQDTLMRIAYTEKQIIVQLAVVLELHLVLILQGNWLCEYPKHII